MCYFNYSPVISSDASSTRPCGLLILLVVVGINVGFFSLLLQDVAKLVFANAAEKCAHIVGFLDHPLQTKAHISIGCLTPAEKFQRKYVMSRQEVSLCALD